MRHTPLTITVYGYTPAIITLCELIDRLQTLWRMFCIVSSLPLSIH
jgi:hypothetical protein